MCLHVHACRSRSAASTNSTAAGATGGATSFLHTCDLMGCHFVGLLMSFQHQLHMLCCDDVMVEGKPPLLNAAVTILPGSQAVSLPDLCMMLVLESQQKRLCLYSGVVKVCLCVCVGGGRGMWLSSYALGLRPQGCMFKPH